MQTLYMIRWVFSALVYIPFFISSILLAPILPLFAKNEFGKIDNNHSTGIEPRLPAGCWYGTPDNSLYGDYSWRTEHCPKYWNTYLGMVLWLLRNPSYGFAWGPLSHTPGNNETYTKVDTSTGYKITSNTGVFELLTRVSFLQIRIGWILGDATPGKPCLFLLSLRKK